MAPGSGTRLRDKLEIDAFDMTCGRRDFGLFRRRELRVSPFEQKKFMSQRFGFPLCVACGTRQPAYLALPGTELGHTRSGLGLGPAKMPALSLLRASEACCASPIVTLMEDALPPVAAAAVHKHIGIAHCVQHSQDLTQNTARQYSCVNTLPSVPSIQRCTTLA